MEFEVDTDTSKGKLIARRIVCLPTGTVSFESVGEERLLGKVDLEPHFVRVSPYKLNRKDDLDSGLGRIVYERNGVSIINYSILLHFCYRNSFLFCMDLLMLMMTEKYILEMRCHFIWQQTRGNPLVISR